VLKNWITIFSEGFAQRPTHVKLCNCIRFPPHRPFTLRIDAPLLPFSSGKAHGNASLLLGGGRADCERLEAKYVYEGLPAGHAVLGSVFPASQCPSSTR